MFFLQQKEMSINSTKTQALEAFRFRSLCFKWEQPFLEIIYALDITLFSNFSSALEYL